ncbi:MAG: glycyl-radical enzyme activating protein [Aeromonadaceae bacterium]
MGMTFNLQRYSTHDGPGIRTVLFLKGCSLSCRWCQNPESCRREPDLGFDARLCLAECQLCCQATPALQRSHEGGLQLDRHRLTGEQMQALAQLCPTGALVCHGQEQSVAEVMALVRQDLPFYRRSGGGLTLSGGEPFMQPEFAAAVLAAAKQEGIHTAVESCLHVPWSYIAPALSDLDLLLADLKSVDEDRFKLWCGGSAQRVMSNFRRLKALGVPVIVRVPLIPEFNCDAQSLLPLLDFVAEASSARQIHFLPYHTYGRHKYQQLGLEYMASPEPLCDPDLLEFVVHEARQRGLEPVLRGEA